MSHSESEKTDLSSRWMDFGKSPVDWVLIAGGCGIAPLLFVQSGNLWSRAHLQFFPLAWIGFIVVVYYFGRINDSDLALRKWIGAFQIGFSLLLTGLAVVAFSPWIAQLAAISLVLGWALIRLGGIHWANIVMWIGLLLITLPLPMNLDERIIQVLQIRSSGSASQILDLMGVKHLLQGNVIEVGDGRLFVDQACSGVDSLYALLAVSLLMILSRKRSLLIGIVQMLTVPLWAWFGNVVRLLVITIGFDRFQVDLLHGWQHTTLGLMTFSLAFVCMIFTQQLVYRLLSPLPVGRHNAGWAHKVYNWLVRWPNRSKGSIDVSTPSRAATVSPQNKGLSKVCVLTLAGFVLLGVVSFGPIWMVGPWKQVSVEPLEVDRGLVESTFVADSLPNDFGKSMRRDFRIEQRDLNDVFGEYSAIWYFQDNQRSMIVSLDFPFSGFHTLEVCYQLIGSQIVGSVSDIRYDVANVTKVIRQGELMDEFNERTFIYYMEFTAGGFFDKPTRTIWERLVPTQLREPLFQIQIVVKNPGTMTESDHERYRQLLLEAQERLMPLIQSMK